MSSFVDRAIIKIQAGDGGNGSASFRREKFIRRGGPDGGDGGRGGNIVIEASPDEQTLEALKYMNHYEAKPGGRGQCQDMSGRNGPDIVLRVPVGTLVRDLGANGVLLADLNTPGARLIAARGGRGGRGNQHFASSTNRAPQFAQDGQPGEERELELELKLVADVGLVGFPNAGKSSFLAAVTKARPAIAAYPFSTLGPHVGIVEFDDYTRMTIADIPGLVSGAHENVGLGHAFLRHIERTRVLAYVLDLSGLQNRLPWEELKALLAELEAYQPGMTQRPALIIANKTDEPTAAANLKKLRRRTKLPIYPVCALLNENTAAVVQALRELLATAPPPPQPEVPPPVVPPARRRTPAAVVVAE